MKDGIYEIEIAQNVQRGLSEKALTGFFISRARTLGGTSKFDSRKL